MKINIKNVTHWLSAGGEGVEVVYSLRNDDTLAKSILDEIGNKGQAKRRVYQRRLPEDPSKDYYFIQRLTNPIESILLEYGFIDNKNDSNRLKNNLNNYVEGAVKAIALYTGYNYNPPNNLPTIDGEYYIVEKNDTLYSIARKFNLSVDDLKRLNNLTSNIISIGQQLLIKENIENPQDESIYIVEKGDTLYSIARKFNITLNSLMNMNNLNSNILSIGQKLIIKDNKNEDNIYIVEKGDSLYSISRKFNTTVNELIKKNNLTSNVLSIGQKLLI